LWVRFFIRQFGLSEKRRLAQIGKSLTLFGMITFERRQKEKGKAMRTLFIYAIRLLLWVGVPSLIGVLLYKISKHDTALMNEKIDQIEKDI
jgi:hypothetical protein